MNTGTYVIHSGIKGMRWGIRRYQNEDGSLTPEGRRHYGLSDYGSNNVSAKTVRKQNKKAIKNAAYKVLTDAELDAQIQRLKKEKEWKSLKQEEYDSTISKGRKIIDDAITKAASTAVSNITNYAIGSTVNKLMGTKVVDKLPASRKESKLDQDIAITKKRNELNNQRRKLENYQADEEKRRQEAKQAKKDASEALKSERKSAKAEKKASKEAAAAAKASAYVGKHSKEYIKEQERTERLNRINTWFNDPILVDSYRKAGEDYRKSIDAASTGPTHRRKRKR